MYPLETSENHRFFDIFSGYKNGTLTRNGLNNYNIGEIGTDLFCYLEALVVQL